MSLNGPAPDEDRGRLAEALLLADPEDQESLDALRVLVEDFLPQLVAGQAQVETPVRECIALLDGDDCDVARDAIERLTDALAPVLDPAPDRLADASVAAPARPAPETAGRGRRSPSASPTQDAPPTAPSPPASLADDPELVREFIDSSREHLDEADACLLRLEQDDKDAEAVNAVFRSFHTIKGMAGFLALQAVEEAAHDAEDTLDAVRKGTLALDQGVMDRQFAAVDLLRELVGQVVVPGAASAADTGAGAADTEVAAADVASAADTASAADVDAAATGGAQTCDDATATPSPEPVPGPARQRTAQPAAPAGSRGTVHVDEERLDRLLETIGELVIAEASVSQSVAALDGATDAAAAHLSRLDKISRQLQEMATSMRMVAFRTTMRRMARLVRDLAREADKPVRCILEGEEIELDKHVVEGMMDSLVHLVRNAVDHGVETDPEERVRAGKPRTATVRISARHTGGRIIIDVEDDGRGIDAAAVTSRAREMGILGPDETPAPDAVARLLFTPGFSTNRTVTEVSGRGVGMDVVKRTAEALMGSVAMTSTPGSGTTVRLTLPLTLAMIDGMLVRVGDERFIIPALAIVRSQRIDAGDITGVLGRSELLATPQGLVPLIRLRQLLAVGDDSSTNGAGDDLVTIVSAADGSSLAGLVVSELLGQHQIVMKSLGEGLGDVFGVSGAAILSDGTVGLVIDVQQTVRLAHEGKG